MNELHIKWVVEEIVKHLQDKDEIYELLQHLSTEVDWDKAIAIRLDEEHERPCGKCREWKDTRQFTFIYDKNGSGKSGYYACPDCLEITTAQTYLCNYCEAPYLALYTPQESDVCFHCRSAHVRVVEHNARTRNLGLEASLTAKQWGEAVRFFDGKCAYCLGLYQVLEHYLPVSLGGGTTVGNCLPSCYRCNTTKKDKYPDVFTRLFPAQNIARIRGYLERVSSLALR